MTALIDILARIVHAMLIAIGAGVGIAGCIFVALFVAYVIWATAADSGTEAR